MYPQLCNNSNVGYKSSDFLKNFPRHSFASSQRLIEVILSFFSLPSTNCAFLMDKWFREKSIKNSLMLAFAMAITCNTRFNGIIFLPVLVVLFVFDSIRNKKGENLRYLILTILAAFLFFYDDTVHFIILLPGRSSDTIITKKYCSGYEKMAQAVYGDV